jgi:hypothetical protein
VTNAVPLHIALEASLLDVSEQEVSSLDQFCLGPNTTNGIVRTPMTLPGSKANYHKMEGLVREKAQTGGT